MKCPKCKQNLNSQGIHAGQDANYCELRAECDRLRTLVSELFYYTVRNANTVELVRRAEAAINLDLARDLAEEKL